MYAGNKKCITELCSQNHFSLSYIINFTPKIVAHLRNEECLFIFLEIDINHFHIFSVYVAILVYRMAAGCSTTCRGTYVKLTHSLLHLATVPCVVFGAVASMEYHRLKGIPHLYSLHSWMGLLTVSLFIIQVISNSIVFLSSSGVSYY